MTLLAQVAFGQGDIGIQLRGGRAEFGARPGAGQNQRRQKNQQPAQALSLRRQPRWIGLGGRRFAHRAKGTRLFAETALRANGGRDAHAPFGSQRGQSEQPAVRTKKPAIGPAHKHPGQQKDRSRRQDKQAARQPEERHERIITANQKTGPRAGADESRAQKNKGNHAQRLFQPERDGDGLDEHKILQRPLRAHSGAKGPPGKQRHHDGREAENQHRGRHGVLRVEQAINDVLGRADHADAAFAVKAEIRQGKEREPEQPPARAFLVKQKNRHGQAGQKHAGIGVLQPKLSRGGSGGGGENVSVFKIRRRETLLGGNHQPQQQHDSKRHDEFQMASHKFSGWWF